MHVAPHLKDVLDLYPASTVDLVLSEAFVDIIGDSSDLAIRIADLEDSSLTARRLAPNHRILCASPTYLDRHGTLQCMDDLGRHVLLSHTAAEWQLEGPESSRHVRVNGRLKTNSSEVVRETVIAGIGVALRSTWAIGPEVKAGSLIQILPEYSDSKRVVIQAVYPSRRHLEQLEQGPPRTAVALATTRENFHHSVNAIRIHVFGKAQFLYRLVRSR
jgi:DNA-binding transcriptional LysR family regulator